ncbi:MAG: hypothetical protein KGI51_07305 [Rhodospirillales bacterium]|nr:hypothetical protein [Rhodospirillales bacterium]
MGDVTIEEFKKHATKGVDDWEKEITKLQKQLDPIDAELKKLSADKKPDDKEKQHIAELTKQRDALREKIHDASKELGKLLFDLDLPTKGDQKDILKLPPFLEGIIKDKGAIPLGPNVSVKPTIDWDFKKMKPKKVFVSLEWHF